MTGRESFEAWAPADLVWSAWAKPTLFVHPSLTPPDAKPTGRARSARPTPFQPQPIAPTQPAPASSIERIDSDDLVWPRTLPRHAALLLELPGPMAVSAGVALRDKGFWPVPLFNATPGPNPIVDVMPTIRALHDAAPLLRGAPDPQTLPCFLLDAARCPQATGKSPGRYDNRSIVFPQDFPSATLMRSRGVEQVVVVTLAPPGDPGRFQPAKDLAHVLHAWQRDGLRLLHTTTTSGNPPSHVSVPKPKDFGLAIRRILALTGFTRSAAGGFGAFIPVVATGSGYS